MNAPRSGLSEVESVESAPSAADALAAEIAHEQAHVDLVYAELAKASQRALSVEADGLARILRMPPGSGQDLSERYRRVTRHARQVAERLLYDE